MKSLAVLFLVVLGSVWSKSILNKYRIQNHPYFASIEVGGKHLCSATIVDDYYVLTAKSCVESLNLTATPVTVRVGTGRIGYQGQQVQASNIYLDDSSFLFTTQTDLAMVKVATAFAYSSNVAWADPNNDGLSEGVEGVVLGWTSTKKHSRMVAGPAVVISTDSCSTALEGVYNLTSLQMCIKSTVSNSQTCLADLGAPFYLDDQVYGVVSYNPGCDSDLPIVISEVGGSGAFIVEVLIDIYSFF